jgi:hypothetical protein
MANTKDNVGAFATVVGRLSELSESELRQLHLIIGVRLGSPDVLPPTSGTVASTASKSGKPSGPRPKGKGKPSAGKTRQGGGKSAGKGNPSRKSQWANHPLYQEYQRLKKAVGAQAKELKCSFNQVDTAESRAYRLAFTSWVEAKCSFRDRQAATEKGSDGGQSSGSESGEQSSQEQGVAVKDRRPASRSPHRSGGGKDPKRGRQGGKSSLSPTARAFVPKAREEAIPPREFILTEYSAGERSSLRAPRS